MPKELRRWTPSEIERLRDEIEREIAAEQRNEWLKQVAAERPGPSRGEFEVELRRLVSLCVSNGLNKLAELDHEASNGEASESRDDARRKLSSLLPPARLKHWLKAKARSEFYARRWGHAVWNRLQANLWHQTSGQPKLRCWVEDAVGEAFARLEQKLEEQGDALSIRARGQYWRWLYQTANRILLDRHRRERLDHLGAATLCDPAAMSDDERIFYRCFDKLSPFEQQILRWTHWDGLKIREIQHQLPPDVPRSMSTIHGYQRKAKEQLRQLLLAEGYNPQSTWYSSGMVCCDQRHDSQPQAADSEG